MSKATVIIQKDNPQTVVIERTFDAPRDKVFKAFTTKELVEKWWVGPGYAVHVEKLEARDGGSWRFIQTDTDGQEFAFHGIFHKVSPEMTIQTFEFEGVPNHPSLDKMTLIQKEGKTYMHIESTFTNVSDLNSMLQSGMEEGMQNTYNQLDKVLQDM
jgi:uncharacterized protein YndB with AHSA1/START domain